VRLEVYLPAAQGAWFAEHREELGRGWASRVLRDAVSDERQRREGPVYDEEAGRAAMAALVALEAEPIEWPRTVNHHAVAP
jgi:hypothetical protein